MFNSFINYLNDETHYPSVDYRVELQFRGCLRNLRNGFKRKEYEVWGIAGLIENWDGEVASTWKAPGGYSGTTMELSMSQKCAFITKQTIYWDLAGRLQQVSQRRHSVTRNEIIAGNLCPLFGHHESGVTGRKREEVEMGGSPGSWTWPTRLGELPMSGQVRMGWRIELLSASSQLKGACFLIVADHTASIESS